MYVVIVNREMIQLVLDLWRRLRRVHKESDEADAEPAVHVYEEDGGGHEATGC